MASFFRGTRVMLSKVATRPVIPPPPKVDWETLEKLCSSPDGKKAVNSFRMAFFDFETLLNTHLNVPTPEINWDYYKEKLGPQIVGIYQKTVEGFKPPEFKEEEIMLAEFRKKMAELEAQWSKEEEEMDKEHAYVKAQIKKIEDFDKRLEHMTVNEYFAEHPEVREEIDEEIRNDLWDPAARLKKPTDTVAAAAH